MAISVATRLGAFFKAFHRSHCWNDNLFEEKYSYQTNTTCRDFNDPLERLPSEIRVRIFKLLDIRNLVKSSKVCRNWKKVAFDGSLWETIDLTRYYKRIASEQIVNLCCAAGGFLKTANFRLVRV
ncbi:hypothetical protein K493DRAFT_360744 [Basidiobolus meristosporus CBS 931.73]|uniref:F-box domain-containing protein n=1 Tax=Basidiobolus meristosporus CBS 931.73 TaxID=1314790 RepID=A0A1Y1XEV6_9FUNG|nr:hypothetical protein K493DRAFT_360744 [Basidiobolus meristosporus CBS 931.73]|eukprot:ORX84311.1 hypothetical protein K493DRAFT_360744 [Basidiobolus meristosporus CBS 931.73]